MTRARDLAAFVSNADGDIKFDTDTLFIDSSANRVGISNDTPARNLSVNSGSSSGYIQLANTNSGTGASNGFEIKLDSAGSLVDLINRENGDMRFFTNNTEHMRIDDSGRVGINLTPSTSDPLTNVSEGILQVNGNMELRYAGSNSDPAGARYFNIVNTDTTLVSDQPLGGMQWIGLDSSNPNSNMVSITAYCDGNAGTSGNIRFKTAGSERARINSNGLTFNGDTAAANALDDYEEGTWTPTVKGITVSSASGIYTKVGRMVTCVGNFTNATSTGSGDARIDNLPFSVGDNMSGTSLEGFGFFQYFNNLGVTVSAVFLTPFQGTDEALIKFTGGTGVGSGDEMGAMDVSQIDVSNVSVRFNLTYFV